jgi:hypothetical protein
MKLGIVTDVHDSVAKLRRALALLSHRTDQVVSLGDAVDSWRPGEPGVAVAALLNEVGAIGVWGNHDAGLSHDVPRDVQVAADPAVLGFGARLRPQLRLEGCLLSHIEPWRDPTRVEDLWAFSGVPDTDERARPSFEATTEPLLLIGHFHCWLAMRESGGRVDWDGTRPLALDRLDRHLVVIAPVTDGWCAMLDTEERVLTPIDCSV